MPPTIGFITSVPLSLNAKGRCAATERTLRSGVSGLRGGLSRVSNLTRVFVRLEVEGADNIRGATKPVQRELERHIAPWGNQMAELMEMDKAAIAMECGISKSAGQSYQRALIRKCPKLLSCSHFISLH